MLELSDYYTAKEAASIVGLKYHTFIYQAHHGRYKYIRWGRIVLFPKNEIDKAAKNATSSQDMESSAG